MSISKRRLTALLATLATTVTLSLPAGSAFGATTAHAATTAHTTLARATTPATHSTSTTHGTSTTHSTSAGHGTSTAPAARGATTAHAATTPRSASPGHPAPRAGTGHAATPGYEPLPNLPVNACQDSSLPRDYGTNFPVPSDPNGFGYANQTVIGWEGNYYAPFAYLSGAYFARGVPGQFSQNGTTYCGTMYTFGAYTYGLSSGQAPSPGSVQWTMAGR